MSRQQLIVSEKIQNCGIEISWVLAVHWCLGFEITTGA